MRERINRLARGIVENEAPRLGISCRAMEEAVRMNTVTRGEFYVYSDGIPLKGLIYSSNYRVRVFNEAFGGVKNKINFEVNSNYLENGDAIKGCFYLVTNGGEAEIPYVFSVELAASGRVLCELNSIEEFAGLASRDMDTALRLFEYPDFVEAPFMKEPRVRGLYDGLKGRGSRQNVLEEFLVACGVKEPVGIVAEDEEKCYPAVESVIEDRLVLKKSTWGYVQVELQAEESFVRLEKTQLTANDFTGDRAEIRFRIDPQYMHYGRNYCRIFLSAGSAHKEIKVTAVLPEVMEMAPGTPLIYKEGMRRYVSMRLDYECGIYEGAFLLNNMLQELDNIKKRQDGSDGLELLRAELCLMQGMKEQAVLILDRCRDSILSTREDNLENYCFYQYLQMLAKDNLAQRDSLLRLVNKYYNDDPKRFYLLLLLMKLDPQYSKNRSMALLQMKEQYRLGCTSPFLYAQACRLLDEEPELLRVMDSFELQSLYFGARKGMIGEKLALYIARIAAYEKGLRRVFFYLLELLYQKYGTDELLGAVCGLLIKGNCRGERYFDWFEKGVSKGIKLTRLYEYYLYSAPESFGEAFCQEVLLYFSYEHTLDADSRAKLYCNVLTYCGTDSKIYELYKRQMEEFTFSQLFEGRLSDKLAVLYHHMLYRDVIDDKLAQALPSILKAGRITCQNPMMKSVVVRFEELADEEVVPLKQGRAYVPLYSDHFLILFQDAYGSRFANVPYTQATALNEEGLEERCYELFPDHPMIRLRRCRDILERGSLGERELEILKKALEEIRFHPLYRNLIVGRIVEYYKKRAMEDSADGIQEQAAYLIAMDKAKLAQEERARICELLINGGYFREAYDMVREYGCEQIRTGRLLKLCVKMILGNLFDQDPLLSSLAIRIFEEGRVDGVLLDYLCEHFNGSTRQMYRILMQAVGEHVETYDMEERLLAQMLFTGARKGLDKTFELYVSRKKYQDNIVRAYFTVKCVDYFLEDARLADNVVSYLEGELRRFTELSRAPVIYILALSRYYSERKELDSEQGELCAAMVEILLANQLIFPYLQNLSAYGRIPDEMMEKTYIQYRGRRDGRVIIKTRVLPEEEEFSPEGMRQVYQGIYVKDKLLFDGELMEFQIYEEEEGQYVLKYEGSTQYEVRSIGKEDRFVRLNAMGLCAQLKEEERLRQKMMDYVVKDEAARKLFTLL